MKKKKKSETRVNPETRVQFPSCCLLTVNGSLHGLGTSLACGGTKNGTGANLSKLIEDSFKILL
jgi:hypothetical protein